MKENYTSDEALQILRTARTRGRKEGAVIGFALLVAIEVFANTESGKKLTRRIFNKTFKPM